MGGKKRRFELKKTLAEIAKVKVWQLILILVPMLFILATLMRFDHIEMTKLKAAVTAADEAGDDVQSAAALQRLKEFTFSHTVINVVEKNGTTKVTFGTGPIYLEKQYLRKASEIMTRAELEAGDDSNPNGNVFAKAMSVCKPLAIANGWNWNSTGYLNCMTGEISKYPTQDTLEDVYVAKLPSTALYRYDFASPVWTPTLTGFFMILCLLLALIILVRSLIWFTIHIALIFIR